MYYDYDISLSGTFHPSRLLTTQSMGKDSFLKLLPKTFNENFEGTLLSFSLYDKVDLFSLQNETYLINFDLT